MLDRQRQSRIGPALPAAWCGRRRRRSRRRLLPVAARFPAAMGDSDDDWGDDDNMDDLLAEVDKVVEQHQASRDLSCRHRACTHQALLALLPVAAHESCSSSS